MTCEHVFFLTNPLFQKGDEALILRRLEICGIPGFALHYEGPFDFRVSHIATGALTSIHGDHEDEFEAIKDAEESLTKAAAHRGHSVEQEMERVIDIVRKKRAESDWPMEA